jgi:hypothetical protein
VTGKTASPLRPQSLAQPAENAQASLGAFILQFVRPQGQQAAERYAAVDRRLGWMNRPD